MGWVVERTDQAGRPRFTAAYRDRGGRIRSAGTFSNRREAEKAAGRQDYKISDGSWIDPAGGRIGFRAYAMDVWLPSRQVTTRAGYLSYLRNHFDHCLCDRDCAAQRVDVPGGLPHRRSHDLQALP